MDVVFYHFDESTSENQQQIDKILPNIKYIIYSQANISYIQVAVMNSGGWFLLLILVFLILIAMCRKHCCLRDNQQRLTYNDILENLQIQQPLFFGNNNNERAASSNADDQKSIGVNSDELNTVSVIEIYHKKRSKMSLNYKKHKEIYKYKACCICLYDYRNGEKIRKLNCNHYFHQKCIDIWFKKNTQCPLCKQSVINAQILSKRSNTTNSDISSTTNSISSSSSISAQSTSSNADNYNTSSSEDEKINNNNNNNNTYSLSDSHCIYNHQRHKNNIYNNNHHVSDDMYISRHSNPNIITHRHRNKHSQSYSSYGSSHSSEIIANTNNHTSTNTQTTTNTVITMTTTNSNNIDISDNNNNNDIFEPMEDNKSFIPLSPKINLYFEKTFLSNSSPSNHKNK